MHYHLFRQFNLRWCNLSSNQLHDLVLSMFQTHDHKSFDWWALKKSILNTLLQAVKAIKGSVIAINGQLIKGSGYLVSAKGRFLKGKGDSITELGKQIASSALLSPLPTHHHSAPSAPEGKFIAWNQLLQFSSQVCPFY